MKPYYQSGSVTLYHGNALEVVPRLGHVCAIVTDPPYGLSFMGKKWDYDVPSVEIWQACLDALRPGGHLLAFAGTRTQHRMAVRIEDAGFEIRDMIAWVYGSGFPKSLDVSKAIDKAAGAERKVVGSYAGTTNIGRKAEGKRGYGHDGMATGGTDATVFITAPATDAAKQWHGWGTALKPALEPITMARKPLIGTVAANVLAHGCGGLNVDACRVGTEEVVSLKGLGDNRNLNDDNWRGIGSRPEPTVSVGRFPANLIHDGSDEVLELFPETSSNSGNLTHSNRNRPNEIYGRYGAGPTTGITDSGSAARFFYCAKASRSERGKDNTHPTVKPIELMRYLIRLVNPPGGIVLDPFAGSGTTLLAARFEGAQSIGIELVEEHCEIIARRLDKVLPF
jgi:DNA modification methylase